MDQFEVRTHADVLSKDFCSKGLIFNNETGEGNLWVIAHGSSFFAFVVLETTAFGKRCKAEVLKLMHQL